MSRMTKRNYFAALINAMLIALLFLMHYSNLPDISIYNISPMILLPFAVSLSMFYDELGATVSCTVIGIFADSASISSSYFHTFFFFLLGFGVSLMMHYMLNNNIRCAVMLAVVLSAAYFVLKWAFFYAFSGLNNSVEYLMQYALPSVLYTAAFIIPFYYLQRAIFRFKTKGGVR